MFENTIGAACQVGLLEHDTVMFHKQSIQICKDLFIFHSDAIERLVNSDGLGDFISKKWNLLSDNTLNKDTRRASSICKMADRHIFFSGGFQNDRPCNDVMKYDVNSNSKVHISSMNVARVEHSSCCVNDTVYVFGGKISYSKITDTIEKL